MAARAHAMPFGAEVRDGGVRFRLWAPGARRVDLCLEGPVQEVLPMQAEDEGWHACIIGRAAAGSRYRYRIDGGMRVPDPASRFQPADLHGPSQVVDPHAFAWQDTDWRGRPWEETVCYELHVGTFTERGTFTGVIGHLDHLAELGVTALELMPVADFPGARNWGYDGALPFAPDHRYGTPDELKALVQAAHARGLMVFLDVVYNHFGPEGNYLHAYAPAFFSTRHQTPWGAAINFDAPGSRQVRDFFIHNALYWLEEYHFDGLRLDAVHAIADDSRPDFLEELADVVRARLPDRQVHLVLENDANQARYLTRDAGPLHYTAQWNDDLHHALHVLLTGETDGYYRDYGDDPLAHLARCLTAGFAYQGEASAFRGGRARGAPSGHLPPAAFVGFLQNHDQVGNRAFGERITRLAAPEAVRAAVALLLLCPATPLLFMGEEWGAGQPFLFFCDFDAELAPRVAAGRRAEFADFPAFRDEQARARIPDPGAPETFAASRLDWTRAAAAAGRAWLAFYRELLAIRHAELTPRRAGIPAGQAGWQRLGPTALEVRWPLGAGGHWVLRANLGDVALPTAFLDAHWVYFTHPPGTDVLPPWSVFWHREGAG
jgi:1,4-alpha-glucan branching enzyme/maltooligosyltrehalose trehalohydrolase